MSASRRSHAKLLFAVAFLAVFLFAASRISWLRTCGHRETLLGRMLNMGASHDCTAGFLVADLIGLYYAQVAFHEQQGRYARTFEELGTEGGSKMRRSM